MSYSSYSSLTTAESYRMLDLSPGASLAEIKAAYRRLSMEYHPDKARDDPRASTKFSKIREAFEVVTGQLKPVEKNPRRAAKAARPPPEDEGVNYSSDCRRHPSARSQRQPPPERERHYHAAPQWGQRRPGPPRRRDGSNNSRDGYDERADTDPGPQGPEETADAAEEDLGEMLADLDHLRARRRAMLRRMLSWVPCALDGELEPHTVRLGERLDALRGGVLVGLRFVQLLRREPGGVPPPDKLRIVEDQVRRCDADINQYTVDLDGLEEMSQQGLDCQDEYEVKELFGDMLIALSSCR